MSGRAAAVAGGSGPGPAGRGVRRNRGRTPRRGCRAAAAAVPARAGRGARQAGPGWFGCSPPPAAAGGPAGRRIRHALRRRRRKRGGRDQRGKSKNGKTHGITSSEDGAHSATDLGRAQAAGRRRNVTESDAAHQRATSSQAMAMPTAAAISPPSRSRSSGARAKVASSRRIAVGEQGVGKALDGHRHRQPRQQVLDAHARISAPTGAAGALDGRCRRGSLHPRRAGTGRQARRRRAGLARGQRRLAQEAEELRNPG